MRKVFYVLLIMSGFVPVFGFVSSHDTTLLIYSLFIVALLNRQFLAGAFARVRLPSPVKFCGAIILSGWLTECLAWLGSYLKHVKNPALLHPQLIPDLILAVGFYGGWAVVWLLVLRRWRFTLGQVFILTGLLGIFVEQNGAVIVEIIASLANPLIAAILVLYVFTVYGSIMGLPYLCAENILPCAEKRAGWIQYLIVPCGMFLGETILFLIVWVIASALHLIPPPQPIWEHPFF